jgi:hypothetical protein
MGETMRDGRFAVAFLALLALACKDEPKHVAKDTAAAGVAVDLERVRFVLPSGWERGTPNSPMRAAQATIPGASGPAELSVFFFGAGKGGDVDANIKRWIAQMDTDPGTIPEREKFDANGFTVTVVDLTGTLLPSQMGMGPKSALPDQRMIGAVVEGPGGPWFFKATGPKATVAAEREHFLEMLRTLQPR